MTEPTDKQLLDAMLAIYNDGKSDVWGARANMARSLKQTPQTVNHWFNTDGRSIPTAWRMYFLQQIRKVTHEH